MAGAAQTKLHDGFGDFFAWDAKQEAKIGGGSVAGSRSSLGNIFDSNEGTFWSPGDGGFAVFLIDPTTNELTDGTVIEITNGRPDEATSVQTNNHAEAAKIYLGLLDPVSDTVGWDSNDDNATSYDPNAETVWQEVGTMKNNKSDNVADTINAGSGIADLTGDTDENGRAVWKISNISQPFNAIWIQDVSVATFPNTTSFDGFDIGEFQVTSVPIPASIALLGAGLIGLGGALRWRSRAA
jgi:hypothetical protein